MVSRWSVGLLLLLLLAAMSAPAPVYGAADVATTGSACPSPRAMGISANPGATCVTGVGTSQVTYWLWTGTAWSQQFILTNPIGATTSSVNVVAGCVAAVIPGIATGQSPVPTCNGGDAVSSVQLRTSTITAPGAGFVTERWRPSRFYGVGYCEKVAIGGTGLDEVTIAGGPGQPRIPC